ncbi:hypothetical protein ACN20G_16475 [Streptomyces sp. BI20]|uniref:hypothetical protein n=1 Tax=Streptomyces sp. BI20 TaxID=3403460 RepID=UPI003C7645CC
MPEPEDPPTLTAPWGSLGPDHALSADTLARAEDGFARFLEAWADDRGTEGS